MIDSHIERVLSKVNCNQAIIKLYSSSAVIEPPSHGESKILPVCAVPGPFGTKYHHAFVKRVAGLYRLDCSFTASVC